MSSRRTNETNKMTKSPQRKIAGMTALFTGSSSEDLARAHFKLWCWTVAKPAPDIGADFVVEIPANEELGGTSFALQVRSSESNKGREIIKHASALRLKNGVLPAFLISINRKKWQIRWVDLEPLFDTDAVFLAGGNLSVPLSDDDAFLLLEDAPPAAFLEALRRGKGRGAMKAVGSMLGLAESIQDHYGRIDSELVAYVSSDGHRNIFTIGARSREVAMSIEVRGPSDDSQAALRAAFEWGRPAVVEAHELILSGSPLLEHLMRENRLTRATFHPEPEWEGRGLLKTTVKGQSSHEEIVDVRLTRGTKGGECSLMLCHGVLRLRFRIGRSGKEAMEVSVVATAMREWNMSELTRADRALKVLTAALEGRTLELHILDFDEPVGSIRFALDAVAKDAMDAQTLPLRAAAALARLARARGWCIQGQPMAQVLPGEMEGWLAADTFDQEGRVCLPAFLFTLRLGERPPLEEAESLAGEFLVQDALKVQLASEVKECFPAWVRFRNYHVVVEAIDDDHTWQLRCTPGHDATLEYLAPTKAPPHLLS